VFCFDPFDAGVHALTEMHVHAHGIIVDDLEIALAHAHRWLNFEPPDVVADAVFSWRSPGNTNSSTNT